MNDVHFSSATDEWSTPNDYYAQVCAVFGPFDTDPCCTLDSAKAKNFFTKADDGLSKPWKGRVWMNPPYGRTIGEWMKKAYEESRTNASVVVCLVPARTDTKWWHDYATKGIIIFIRGRLKFGDAKNAAPFPSALVVFTQSLD